MLVTIKNLFSELKNKNIPYCHWKSTNHLDATMDGQTDLDILFDKSKASQIEILLTGIGFRRFETANLRSYPGIHDYICLDDSGVWVHLHLHYMLNLGDRWVKAYYLPIELEILSRAQFLPKYDTYIIHPYDELLLHCVRMSLKFRNPFNKKKILEELYFLKEKISNYDISKYELLFQSVASLKSTLKYIEDNDIIHTRTINKLSHRISKELFKFRRFNGFRFQLLSCRRKIYRYYIEFRRRYLHNYKIGRRKIITGGKIVAVVGIDGSGKTTAVSSLERFFAIQMNVCRVFMGNGQSGASWYRKLIFGIYGTKLKGNNNSATSNNKRKISVLYALWILLCLFDKEKNLKRAISAKANGSLVVSDRWPQTDVIGTFDGQRIHIDNPKNQIIKYVKNREQRFLLLASLIKPDLVVKLHVSPEVSMQRKPGDLNYSLAKNNSELLKELTWDSETVNIDGNAPARNVIIKIYNTIWSVFIEN